MAVGRMATRFNTEYNLKRDVELDRQVSITTLECGIMGTHGTCRESKLGERRNDQAPNRQLVEGDVVSRDSGELLTELHFEQVAQ